MNISLKHWRKVIKPIVFVIALIPVIWWADAWRHAFAGLPNGLGFNPNEASNQFTGDWAIRFLLITLMITPLTKVLKSNKPMLFRRMFGLFTSFYVAVHITSYLWLDIELNLSALWQDILKRNYITIGMIALVLLLPLTLTSFNRAVKYLGAKRWRRLHTSIYLIGALAIFHFVMMRKGFQLEPLVYGVIYLSLMVFRLKTR